MANTSFDDGDYEAYYREISDGCDCMELWECLSKRRRGWTKPDQRR
ncbi:hypothetical protein HWV23_00980 [Natronomonas halophila]|nr:hypothetical protein [Natronomonas halophila]QLD84338.1 hypothetical protein HWV23_00980 [Natronomonas halophila]